MRLKPGGVLLLLLIGALIAYFVFKRTMTPATTTDYPTSGTTTRTTEDTGLGNSQSANYGDGNKTTTAPAERRNFNYTPEKPVNGSLRGVVEVGATGFNSFVINMDAQRRWEIVSKDFGESLAYEGLATTDDIRAGLKKYLAGMFDKGVSNKNMHFVISSGAQKEPKTTTISNELKKMGYVVNNVTAAQEAKFALKATLPPQFAENSFLVDIGSGNTKISWDEGGTLRALELPGAKYYEKGTSDDAVYNEVKGQVAKIPEGKRNVCFILGGVPFTLAKPVRSGEERYTVLNAPGSYKAVDKKMASGLNIYKAIEDGTKTDTFVFDWDANFTIGFLLSLP
ncbi:MAG TPA: hypothetical protein VM010_06205 [Chitinophagaceae bacterium]|nr:hypothetical protein [Chitinophagaceae bacterium]